MLVPEIQTRPFLSIIIATKNEERYIGKLLDSIFDQTYPKTNFEVLIVDGMSKDATLKVVDNYRALLNLRVLINPRIRSTFAFNLGLNEAKGELFMIVGAHSYLQDDFIEKAVNTFLGVRKNEPKLVGVGGIILNESDSVFGKIVGLLYSSLFSGARSCRYNLKPHFSDSVIFGLFDKKIVVENGKFDEDFISAGNDDELTIRLHKKGFKFFTNPEIIAHYEARDSLKKFLLQTYNYGVAKGIIVRKGNYKPEFTNSASLWFVPACFFLYEISLLFLFIFSGFSLLWIFSPFVFYWLINIVVFFQLLVRTKTPLCLALPPMYFIFHNVLGLSSLLGLILKKKVFM
jgi:dolichyl N-acetyl-alpha-D-glucosaminyl phosphate 3-beta-D-2,3-diacetamido-2,3-dideoxy-beta-D-glucuronosyltransferase